MRVRKYANAVRECALAHACMRTYLSVNGYVSVFVCVRA